jgi:arylformamidase
LRCKTETPHDERVLIDLSHTITNGMTTYPGLPGPEITEHITRAETATRMPDGVSFTIGRVCMVGNVGTYIDVPFHFYEDGDDLAAIALSRVANIAAVTIDATGIARGRAIGPELFNGVEVAGKAVLVHTGWDRHFGSDGYGVEAPFITREAIELLVAHGAALVGIDSVNIDDIGDLTRPAHCGLLGNGIPIVEHLTGLARLPADGFAFTATPPKFTSLGTFPVRAFATVMA